MSDPNAFPLPVVDGFELDDELREILRPGELMEDEDGRARRLPRFFYEVESWEQARGLPLTHNFALWEFLDTDVREVERLRRYPRYVPCAITLLAAHLEVVRQEVGTLVHIAANGGYRSPGHELSRGASPHMWGTAVNIYRIGSDYIDSQDSIERYTRITRELLSGVWIRPYGHGAGYADDHLHIDLGYAGLVPRAAASQEGTAFAGVGDIEEEAQ